MTNHNLTISTLNDLIQVNHNGEKLFNYSIKRAADLQLKEFLIRRSIEVVVHSAELQGVVVLLGGEPKSSSSIYGIWQHAWFDLKTLISTNVNMSVLKEVERGEEVVVNAYTLAIEKDVLPHNIRSIVLRQLDSALRNFSEIKELLSSSRTEAVN